MTFQAMYVFLGLNGLRTDASEEDAVGLIVEFATGGLDEAALADWLRSRATAI